MEDPQVRRYHRWSWVLYLIGPLLAAIVILTLPIHPLALARFRVAPGADSVTVVAGERYRAGKLRRFLQGKHYRDLWTEPVTLEVLQLDRVAGGLHATKEGGGKETRALHFVSDSGRQFVFRSSDKEINRNLRHGLGGTLLAWIVQDYSSAIHPAASSVAASLQAALGLPAPHPRLVVLPDDERLGAFRERFQGLMGLFQEAAQETVREPGRRDAPELKETAELLALLDQDSTQRVDARGLLTARLLDLFLNDWDRHSGQWRWAPSGETGETLWRPIPVDRDQAFAHYDGFLMDLARLRSPKLSEFGPDYPKLRGLTWNSAKVDERLLSGIGRAQWDSVVEFVESRLTDSVIDQAVATMPEAYRRLSGGKLAAILKQRRAGLRKIATQFYDRLQRKLAKGSS